MSAGVPAALLVRAPNWLGDTVMAQPALAGLRAALPEATITVVGRWASALRGQGIGDALLDYPASPARRRFARALAGARPELAVVLPNSFEAARSARRWGARQCVGFDTDARGLYLTHRVPLPEPRRPGRLAVVAGPLERGARAEDEGGAVVARVVVGATQLVDDRAGGVLVGGAATDPEEARPLLLDLSDTLAPGDQVAAHQSPARSPPMRTMNAPTTTMKKIRTKPAPFEIATRAPR